MAGKTIKLPKSGATVVLRDPLTLKVKDRNKVYAAASEAEGLLQGVYFIQGIVAILVESWTLELIIPSVSASSLEELAIEDYDTLAAEAKEVQNALFPILGETVEGAKDIDSPFDNSNG
jgi:hypothetical protein